MADLKDTFKIINDRQFDAPLVKLKQNLNDKQIALKYFRIQKMTRFLRPFKL